MNKDLIYSILFILIGAFSVLGSLLNWDFFFNSRKAKFLVNLIGKKAATIFYAIIGVLIIVFGILLALDKVPMKN